MPPIQLFATEISIQSKLSLDLILVQLVPGPNKAGWAGGEEGAASIRKSNFPLPDIFLSVVAFLPLEGTVCYFSVYIFRDRTGNREYCWKP